MASACNVHDVVDGFAAAHVSLSMPSPFLSIRLTENTQSSGVTPQQQDSSNPTVLSGPTGPHWTLCLCGCPFLHLLSFAERPFHPRHSFIPSASPFGCIPAMLAVAVAGCCGDLHDCSCLPSSSFPSSHCGTPATISVSQPVA